MATTNIYSKTSKRSAPSAPSNRWRVIAASTVLIAVVGFAIYWLRNDGTVTLNVTGADVQSVVKEIARQGKREIILAPNASGTVTLNIRKKSVGDALEAVAAQTFGSWHEYYAVADSTDSIELLKKSYGEGGKAEGWTRPRNIFGGFGGRRVPMGNVPKEITYTAAATPAKDVALALTYRMMGEVIVADVFGESFVTLVLEKKRTDNAVNEFANRLNGKLDHFFVLRTGNRRALGAAQPGDGQQGNNPPPPPWMTGNRQGQGGRGNNPQQGDAATPQSTGTATPATPDTTPVLTTPNSEPQSPDARSASAPQQQTSEPQSSTPRSANSSSASAPRMRLGAFGGGANQSPERRAEAEREWQRQLDAMTPEQREQMEDIGNKMRNVKSPQEAMQIIQDYVNKNPAVVDRVNDTIMERLKTSTPEQRVEFYRQFNQMRKMMEQFQQNQSVPPPAIPPPPSTNP